MRDGGSFDNRRIRQTIQPASGLTRTGWWSPADRCPAQQRFSTFTADAGHGDGSVGSTELCASPAAARRELDPRRGSRCIG